MALGGCVGIINRELHFLDGLHVVDDVVLGVVDRFRIALLGPYLKLVATLLTRIHLKRDAAIVLAFVFLNPSAAFKMAQLVLDGSALGSATCLHIEFAINDFGVRIGCGIGATLRIERGRCNFFCGGRGYRNLNFHSIKALGEVDRVACQGNAQLSLAALGIHHFAIRNQAGVVGRILLKVCVHVGVAIGVNQRLIGKGTLQLFHGDALGYRNGRRCDTPCRVLAHCARYGNVERTGIVHGVAIHAAARLPTVHGGADGFHVECKGQTIFSILSDGGLGNVGDPGLGNACCRGQSIAILLVPRDTDGLGARHRAVPLDLAGSVQQLARFGLFQKNDR